MNTPNQLLQWTIVSLSPSSTQLREFIFIIIIFTPLCTISLCAASCRTFDVITPVKRLHYNYIRCIHLFLNTYMQFISSASSTIHFSCSCCSSCAHKRLLVDLLFIYTSLCIQDRAFHLNSFRSFLKMSLVHSNKNISNGPSFPEH